MPNFDANIQPSLPVRRDETIAPADFALAPSVDATQGEPAPDRMVDMEGQIARLSREISALRGRHAAVSESGGRFIHHLGQQIAAIEFAISALRAAAQRKAQEGESGKGAMEAELATLESSLRQMRGFSGITEAELAGMLAGLLAAQGDAQALLAMIERIIAALQAEFASFRG
ncbi:MAG: hypothetical protein EA385_01185 [Salinarimonadaceae bacterium]|nr:MAG: hypothetical protein EA385_01185 [Salinarimonadaceae bacterium]